MSFGWFDSVLDVVLSPALWLGALLATIYSLLFTAWRGGGWKQLPRDLLAGLIGFGIGQIGAVLVHLDLLRIGEVRLLGATLGAVIGLLLGRVIGRRLHRLPRTPAAFRGRQHD